MTGAKSRGLGRRGGQRLFATEDSSTLKRPSTKELLIEISEELFGRYGFDGISLREIAVAAGQANKNAVQYHFKDKAGLVKAILENRLFQVEISRTEYLANLHSSHPQYSRELIRTLWLPSLAIQNQKGEHTFCRFLLQLMLQPQVTGHPIATFYTPTDDNNLIANMPTQVKAAELFMAHFKEVPPAILSQRMLMLNKLFLAAVVEYDNARLINRSSVPAEFDIEPLLDLCIGALRAPVGALP